MHWKALLLGGIIAATGSASRSKDGQWTGINNLPKSLNVTPGGTLSSLGIEPGTVRARS